MAAVAEGRMEIPAGHCMGCGEAISSRQKSTRFPGPNQWQPDLSDGTAVFHDRQECAGSAYRYRQQWERRGGAEGLQLPTNTPAPAPPPGRVPTEGPPPDMGGGHSCCALRDQHRKPLRSSQGATPRSGVREGPTAD